MEEPEPDRLEGEITEQFRPSGNEDCDKVTIPPNPFRPAIVIVEVTDSPELAGGGRVPVIVKSVKVNIAVVVWVSIPSVAVRVAL